MNRFVAAGVVATFFIAFAGCSAPSGSTLPSVVKGVSCVSSALIRATSSARHDLDTTPGGLPTNDSAAFYSATSSDANYELGAGIIEFGGTPSGGKGGGGGPVTDGGCSSPLAASVVSGAAARHAQSFVPYNCLDWFLETVPGVENPADDLYLGTTCNSMWIPQSYTPTGGFMGGGDAGATTCAAGNVDDIQLACMVAFAARACAGAKNINQPASDLINDQHSNRISGEIEVAVVLASSVQETIGWEYQTYGGQEYFQFAFTFSVNAGAVSMSSGAGPLIPFKGSVLGVVQGLAKLLGTTQQQLPAPFNTMSAVTQIGKTKC